jgi:hypothetical protein
MPAGATLKRNPPKETGELVNYIWRRDLGPCVVCPFEGGECAGAVQGHHIVPKELLKKRGFGAHLMDLRNRLSVCQRRHAQHTNKFKPIPRELLSAQAFEFAHELALGWYLEKHYPTASERGDRAVRRPAEHGSLDSRSETAGEVAAA